jgi:hypothetical protein
VAQTFIIKNPAPTKKKKTKKNPQTQINKNTPTQTHPTHE